MTEEDLTYKLLTGEIVKNHKGTFYFSEPGNWINSNGHPVWCKLHRENGPAAEYANGTKFWYLNGELHREDGPAHENADGNKYWYLNGKRHRTDGPAIEGADGNKYWYLNGERHREDGPATEYTDGSRYWYLSGEFLTEKEFNQQIKSK